MLNKDLGGQALLVKAVLDLTFSIKLFLLRVLFIDCRVVSVFPTDTLNSVCFKMPSKRFL